jgi:hypothetical protein
VGPVDGVRVGDKLGVAVADAFGENVGRWLGSTVGTPVGPVVAIWTIDTMKCEFWFYAQKNEMRILVLQKEQIRMSLTSCRWSRGGTR